MLNCSAITHKIQLISPTAELFALLYWTSSDHYSLHLHMPCPGNHCCPFKRCSRRWQPSCHTCRLPQAPGCPGRGVFSMLPSDTLSLPTEIWRCAAPETCPPQRPLLMHPTGQGLQGLLLWFTTGCSERQCTAGSSAGDRRQKQLMQWLVWAPGMWFRYASSSLFWV